MVGLDKKGKSDGAWLQFNIQKMCNQKIQLASSGFSWQIGFRTE